MTQIAFRLQLKKFSLRIIIYDMLTHIDDRNKHSCSSPIDERALLFLAKSLVDLKGAMRILTFQSLLGIFYLFPSFLRLYLMRNRFNNIAEGL